MLQINNHPFFSTRIEETRNQEKMDLSRSDRKRKGVQVNFMNKNIAKIDKILLVRRKHKKGRILNQISLLGGIEQVSKKNDKKVIFLKFGVEVQGSPPLKHS